jgi:hypothetical protein
MLLALLQVGAVNKSSLISDSVMDIRINIHTMQGGNLTNTTYVRRNLSQRHHRVGPGPTSP